MGPEGRRKLLPHERKLLTDQQLRDASIDQIEDLVHRLNLALQERKSKDTSHASPFARFTKA